MANHVLPTQYDCLCQPVNYTCSVSQKDGQQYSAKLAFIVEITNAPATVLRFVAKYMTSSVVYVM